LSPVFDKENVKNYLNVFEERLVKKSSKKLEILIAGLTNPDNKDLKRLRQLMHILMNNHNKLPNGQTVLFHIINYYEIDDKFKPFEKAGLLKIYVKTPAPNMMRILQHSSYTMVIAKQNSSYHTKQLSGIIPLSISCGIPLICDKKLAKIYGMSRICVTYTFTKDYLYRALKNAANKNLSLMQQRVIAFRDRKIIANRRAKVPCL